ncbi:MAG: hypothetical protein QM601_04765 [Pseudoxanthomonas sp.]
MTALRRHCLPTAALLLAACSPPPAPQPDQPPAPRADRLGQAIQQPLQRARSVQDTVDQGEARRRKQLDQAENP